MKKKLILKTFNIKGKKYNKNYILYSINKQYIKLGITNYILNIFLNNKYLVNKYLKISNNISKHCLINILYKNNL
uniref:Uncharacterized protein n=1 Tax=Babesia duncani TaxID=323732 RepID=A0A385GNK8_9APIC|nr:hypothetical protein [Babesia duncani]